VLAELEKAGYTQANPNAKTFFANGAGSGTDGLHRPSRDFGYGMNISSSPATDQDAFYQMYSEKDIILWIGCSPPRGTWYFGCTEYLDNFALSSDKGLDPSSSRVPFPGPSEFLSGAMASMGDSFNQLTMRSTSGDFWDSTIVIITTPDDTAAKAVTAALQIHAPSLVPAVNVQVVASLLSTKINFGTGKEHSVFSTGCRIAPGNLDDFGSDIRETAKRYLEHQEPLLYLDGTSRVAVANPYQTPPLRPRIGGGRAERALASTFETLLCEVKKRAFDMGFVHLGEETTLAPMTALGKDFYLNGTRCILDGGNCLQDSQDALYTTASVNGSTMQVALGVNHRLSQMATYGYIQMGGDFSVHDRQSEGSAVPWASQIPNADRFIALIVRSSQNECDEMPADLKPWCYSVSSSKVGYNERAYLNPVTKTGPDASEMLPTKVIRFIKKTFLGKGPTCEGGLFQV